MSTTERSRSLARAGTGALVALLFVAPLLIMVTGSLRRPGLPPPRSLEVVPRPVTAEGYREAFRLSPLAKAMGNSLFVASVYATTFLPLYTYRNAFEFFRFGYAASMTLVMYLVTLALVGVQLRVARRRWTA